MTEAGKKLTAVEALAEAWASIDGKLEQFQSGKTSEDNEGYFQGYLADSHEMIARLRKRGFDVVPGSFA